MEETMRKAYFWAPDLGIKIDLGAVERGSPGAIIREEKFESAGPSNWTDYGAKSLREGGRLSASEDTLMTLNQVNEMDLVAAVDAHSDTEAALVLRFHDADNYLAAVYSKTKPFISLTEIRVWMGLRWVIRQYRRSVLMPG
jgi:hypothetical protein